MKLKVKLTRIQAKQINDVFYEKGQKCRLCGKKPTWGVNLIASVIAKPDKYGYHNTAKYPQMNVVMICRSCGEKFMEDWKKLRKEG